MLGSIDKENYCEVGDCNESADTAHIRTRATLAKSKQNDSNQIYYLCRKHHTEQHSIGIESFCKKYGFTDRLNEARGYL